MQSHSNEPCNNIINAYFKCSRGDTHIQSKCKEIETLLVKGNLTFSELYFKCYEKTKITK